MKIIIVFSAFIAFALCDMAPLREACKAELNIPDASIDKYRQWKFDDEHSACYIECIFKKMRLFADGNFNVDVLAEKLKGTDKTVEEIKPEIEKCIDNSIADSCQKAFAGFKCFKENDLYRVQESAKRE